MCLKRRLKLVPGLISTVTYIRRARKKITLLVLRKFISWSIRTSERRALAFEALPGPLVIANYSNETYIISTSDKVIGRSIFAKGSFDFQKFLAAITLIKENTGILADATLIDVGANIGSISIPALQRGYVENCIAFELDPLNARLLKANSIINGVEDRIDVRNVAVGSDSGAVSVLHSQSNFGDHRVRHDNSNEEAAAIAMVPLDSIASNLDMNKTILWMDIQGYEAYALEGASKFIKARVPLISELAPEELLFFNSLDLFVEILCGSSYQYMANLNDEIPKLVPLSRAALLALSDRLLRERKFTDLLFLP